MFTVEADLAQNTLADTEPAGRSPAPESQAADGMDLEFFLRPLFAQLKLQGVEYAVLRNYQAFPARAHKADVSLLVSDRHSARLRRAFEHVCAELGRFSLIHPGRKQNMVMLALAFDVNEAGEPRVDRIKVDARLYESFKLTPLQKRNWGINYKVFSNQIKRRTLHQDGCEFVALDQPDELIFLFKQWKRKNSPYYRDQIIAALADPGLRSWFAETTGRLAANPSAELPGEYAPELDDLVWRMVRRRWGAHTPIRFLKTHLRAAALWISRWQPGPMLYFAGPDGCGKTTTVDAAKTMFHDEGIRYKYIYSFKRVLRFFTKRLAWLKLRAKSPSGNAAIKEDVRQQLMNAEHADRDTGQTWWRLRKRLTLLIGLVDIFMGYMLAIPFRLLGRVVLVETSPYDVYIKYHMPEFERIESITAPLLPTPTRCLVLRADSQAIFKRKPELSRDEIDEYYRRLDRVLQRAKLGSRAVDVRTDSARSHTIIGVWRAILEAMKPD